MHTTRLGMATASLTACVFVGAFGSAHAALGAGVGLASQEPTYAAKAADVLMPAPPRRGGHGHHGGGPQYSVFALDENSKRSSSVTSHQTLIALGNAYASGARSETGSVAIDDFLAQRTALIERQTARGPPSV